MADKNTQQTMLIGKRVSALAVVVLTRRADLVVEESRGESGPDLLVRLMPAGKEGERQFGVETKGAWPAMTKDRADIVVGRSVWEAQKHGPFAFPVCLFFFTMEENQGWYTWIAEPFIHARKAQLQMRGAADCKPLDQTAVDDIVSRVDRWYDAFYENLVATSVNGGKPGRKPAKH
jgi:hypothetical protein